MIRGLSGREKKMIRDRLKQFGEIDKAVLFGSRAFGKHKKGSDVDIALFGPGVTVKTISKVYDILNEDTPLPYFFDIVMFSSINNENLKQHILEYGDTI